MSQVFSIQSSKLKVSISEIGAEIISVKSVSSGFEFMWDANTTVWNRHAPVLFPIVGKLNQNKIKIGNHEFEMNQHGFARDLVFEPIEVYSDLLKFMLISDEKSLTKFPFHFKFFITYQLFEDELKISYSTMNEGNEMMYFSVGAHPGFKLPSKDLSQFYIEFEKPENLTRHLLSDGLFNKQTEIIGLNQNKLQLSNELFAKDAIVLKNLKSAWVNLRKNNSNFAIKLDFKEFPFLGIWTKAGQDGFICLEPWQGLADCVGFNNDISEKEGICTLEPKEAVNFDYSLTFCEG